MAEKENKKETKENSESRGIAITMKQLITLSFVLAAVFAGIAVFAWLRISPAVGFNAAAIAAIACFVGIRAVLYEKRSG